MGRGCGSVGARWKRGGRARGRKVRSRSNARKGQEGATTIEMAIEKQGDEREVRVKGREKERKSTEGPKVRATKSSEKPPGRMDQGGIRE